MSGYWRRIRSTAGSFRRGIRAGCTSLGIGLLAAQVLAATTPGRPAEVKFAFFPVTEPWVLQGPGGTPAILDGMEMWEFGRPARRNRVLGTLEARVELPATAEVTGWTPAIWSQHFPPAQVTAAARGLRADAIVPVAWRREGSQLVGSYRLVKYLAAGELEDTPTKADEPILDAAGAVAANGSAQAIEFEEPPDVARYVGSHGFGSTVVHFCVGADGGLIGSPSLVSSTNPALDEPSMRLIREARFLPATVQGKPVRACKNIKISSNLAAGERPYDPADISTVFQTASGMTLYRGTGGIPTVVNDVEIWHSGRPSRRNRLLGTVIVSVPAPGIEYAPVDEPAKWKPLVEARAVAAARRMNAAALVPMGLRAGVDTLAWHYRAIQYLEDREAADAQAEDDAAPRDGAGNIAPNGSERPIQFRHRPDLWRYTRGHVRGTVVLHFCADARGRLTGPPSIVSTTNVELNAPMIRMIVDANLIPATIGGQPMPHCQDMTIDTERS